MHFKFGYNYLRQDITMHIMNNYDALNSLIILYKSLYINALSKVLPKCQYNKVASFLFCLYTFIMK